MTDKKTKQKKTEFFGAIVFLVLSAMFLVPALQGRTVIHKRWIPVSPWQGICAGLTLLPLALLMLWRSLRAAFTNMRHTTNLKSTEEDAEHVDGEATSE